MPGWMGDDKPEPWELQEEQETLIDHMLETLADESQIAKRLSKWEQQFVESVTDQWARTKRLSAAQFDKLEAIYTENTV